MILILFNSIAIRVINETECLSLSIGSVNGYVPFCAFMTNIVSKSGVNGGTRSTMDVFVCCCFPCTFLSSYGFLRPVILHILIVSTLHHDTSLRETRKNC